MTLETFAKSWLKAQGVEVLGPCPRERTRVVGKREGEMNIPMPQCEHGDPS